MSVKKTTAPVTASSRPDDRSASAGVPDLRKALGFRPLYRQVKDVLLERIATGIWKAGGVLPSETEIATEFGVSQGTVRKALDELTSENLVVRRQGKGTFVALHDEARILFQFFKLFPDTGGRGFPESQILEAKVCVPDSKTREILELPAGQKTICIERLRRVGDDVAIFESISVPKSSFPGLETRALPNNLYGLFRSEYGVTITRASERLKAIAATAREARHLSVAVGTPLLLIDRTAFAIDGRPVERRVSQCRTDQIHYSSDLR